MGESKRQQFFFSFLSFCGAGIKKDEILVMLDTSITWHFQWFLQGVLLVMASTQVMSKSPINAHLDTFDIKKCMVPCEIAHFSC